MNHELGAAAAGLTIRLLGIPGFVVAAAAEDKILCMVTSKKHLSLAPLVWEGFPVEAMVAGKPRPA